MTTARVVPTISEGGNLHEKTSIDNSNGGGYDFFNNNYYRNSTDSA